MKTEGYVCKWSLFVTREVMRTQFTWNYFTEYKIFTEKQIHFWKGYFIILAKPSFFVLLNLNIDESIFFMYFCSIVKHFTYRMEIWTKANCLKCGKLFVDWLSKSWKTRNCWTNWIQERYYISQGKKIKRFPGGLVWKRTNLQDVNAFKLFLISETLLFETELHAATNKFKGGFFWAASEQRYFELSDFKLAKADCYSLKMPFTFA